MPRCKAYPTGPPFPPAVAEHLNLICELFVFLYNLLLVWRDVYIVGVFRVRGASCWCKGFYVVGDDSEVMGETVQ